VKKHYERGDKDLKESIKFLAVFFLVLAAVKGLQALFMYFKDMKDA